MKYSYICRLFKMYFYFFKNGEFTFAICFVITIISGQQNQKNEQAICNRYNIPEITWTCKRVQDCKWASNIINTAQEHRCGSDRYVVKLCCPELTNVTPKPKPTSTTTLRPTSKPKPTTVSPSRKNYIQIIQNKCIDYFDARYTTRCVGGIVFGQEEVCKKEMDCKQTVPLITGGVNAEAKEFPHMALVGFGNDINDIDWACGGSLISDRFVLSAAHCTNPSSVLGEVKWIGLGVLDRNELTPEKYNENIFRVVRTYNHPGYKGSQVNHDIALYQLQNSVKFNPNIRPICLHTENSVQPKDENNATITGWGIVDIGADVSDRLLKATVRILPETLCINQYLSEPKLKNGFEGSTMVCAGDQNSNQDTCTGDSGGPIQINHKETCMYTQVGITSLGSSFCGDHTPAIYTRVFAYLEWIQKIVWPNGA